MTRPLQTITDVTDVVLSVYFIQTQVTFARNQLSLWWVSELGETFVTLKSTSAPQPISHLKI